MSGIEKPKELIGVIDDEKGKLIGIVTGAPGSEIYEGPYSATADAHEDVILATRLKYMNGNVTIEKIPYAEVTNLSGGKTATIG